MNSNQIPVLYLLENVFYPDTIIPMVLTDEPSKILVQEVYKNDKLIALYSNHPKSRGVATVGKILLIDDKKEPGKLTAVIQGIDRVVLNTIIQHIPYPVYECSRFSDVKETHFLNTGALERLHDVFEKYLCRHVANMKEREVFLKEISSPKKLIFNVCLFMIKDIELKILFLESTSMSDRINILDVLLTGDRPESEDKFMAEAIKNFERFDQNLYKNTAN